MADTLQTKKVTDLTENTAMSDEDLFMVGSAGTASLRKLKWSNIWNTIKTAILGKLVANNLTTTAAGYLLDARQGKALDDKISKLNTDLFLKWKYITSTTSNSVNAETLSLTAPKDCWCVIRGFKYWDTTYVNINGNDVLSHQTSEDSNGKVSFTNIFPVKNGVTVAIKKPTNNSQREFAIAFYE